MCIWCSADFELGDSSLGSLKLCTVAATASTPLVMPVVKSSSVSMKKLMDVKPVATRLSADVKRKTAVTSTPCILRGRRRRRAERLPQSSTLTRSSSCQVTKSNPFVSASPRLRTSKRTESFSTPKKSPAKAFLPFSPSQVYSYF